MSAMIDPKLRLQTHTSLETPDPAQTHTMLEETANTSFETSRVTIREYSEGWITDAKALPAIANDAVEPGELLGMGDQYLQGELRVAGIVLGPAHAERLPVLRQGGRVGG
jgi:hypothetical protein